MIRQEVLNRNRKALVLFGSAHLYRNRPGTLVDLLQDDSGARWFIVVPAGGPGLPDAITDHPGTPAKPILLPLAGSEVGSLHAADLLERGTRRIKVAGGKPVLEGGKPVFIPVFEGDIKVGDLADACLYFGGAAPELVQPPQGLYNRTEYGAELQRRRSIVELAMSPD